MINPGVWLFICSSQMGNTQYITTNRFMIFIIIVIVAFVVAITFCDIVIYNTYIIL